MSDDLDGIDPNELIEKAADRIEELEAESARLREALKEIDEECVDISEASIVARAARQETTND